MIVTVSVVFIDLVTVAITVVTLGLIITGLMFGADITLGIILALFRGRGVFFATGASGGIDFVSFGWILTLLARTISILEAAALLAGIAAATISFVGTGTLILTDVSPGDISEIDLLADKMYAYIPHAIYCIISRHYVS